MPSISRQIPVRAQAHFGPITVPKLVRWTPVLATWGVGAAGAVTLIASVIPLFQADVLRKVPGLAPAFTDDTPDSDKPF